MLGGNCFQPGRYLLQLAVNVAELSFHQEAFCLIIHGLEVKRLAVGFRFIIEVYPVYNLCFQNAYQPLRAIIGPEGGQLLLVLFQVHQVLVSGV